ncbi:MAG: AraC family transcriptional regulator, partial [Bacteroidota bacterium]
VLSKVINGVYGMNFNDFINARRCEAFLRKIREGDHRRHTLLSIALDCGFNSKSTFNRAFRKHAGISPGQAVRELVAG